MSLLLNVDVDGVIYPFTQAIRNKAAVYLDDEKYRTAPSSEDWSMHEVFDLDPNEWDKMFEWAALNGVFNDFSLNPYPHAVSVLTQLHYNGHHIRLVTAKPILSGHKTHAIGDMIRWLRRHEVPYNSLVVDYDKSRYPCDVAIDDKPNTTNWMTGDLNILFDQPWNQNTNVDRWRHGWRRAFGWLDAYDAMHEEAIA